MFAKEFSEFEKLVRKQLSNKTGQKLAIERSFKKVLGRQVFDLTDDPSEQSKLVLAAIEISGAKPGRVEIKEGYGEGLVHNNRSNGSGSFLVSLALYYYLLKCHDTPTYRYSECVKALNLFVLGKESFERYFDWAPEKIALEKSEDIAMSWAVFLKKYGHFEGIDVVLSDKKPRGRHGLTDIQTDEPLFDGRVVLGRGFQFHGSVPFSGASLSFQMLGHRTYPFVFSERRLLRQFDSGNLVYPSQEGSNESVFYNEREDAREFKYVLVLVSARLVHLLDELLPHLKLGSEIESHALDKLAAALSETASSFVVRMINIKFEEK